VLIPAVMPCGVCELCLSGHGTICRKQQMPGNDIQGGFASHILVPVRGLCPVDEQKLKAAGLELADISVVADAVTTPYQAAVQAEVEPGDLAIVVGIGGVGGYAVQIARAMGATVVAIDVDQAKLDNMANFGASLTINAREVQGRDMKKAITAFVKEKGLRETCWKIFECSGSAVGQETAYGLMTYGATLSVVGFTMDKLELRLSNLMAFHARALGNWGCLTELYPAALDMVLDGKIALAPFIEKHPLNDINQVFAAAHEHKLTRRAILVPNP
jgi:6-hydroxycyclohex-1-ene-1-carbonyl-CoA dehydrogenase